MEGWMEWLRDECIRRTIICTLNDFTKVRVGGLSSEK